MTRHPGGYRAAVATSCPAPGGNSLRFKFMELGAKLHIADTVEADFAVNDVLDVAITRHNPTPLVEGATIGVHPPLFNEIPKSAVLVVTPTSGKIETFGLGDGIDLGDGLLRFVIPDPLPGTLYSAEIRINPSMPGVVLFKDVELHQMISESQGGATTPLPAFGVDPLAFDSAPAEPPPGQAVQGGPEETSDQQLAQLDARAGNTALA